MSCVSDGLASEIISFLESRDIDAEIS